MKITKVIRTRSAQCYPQVLELKHHRSFDLLLCGAIDAKKLDGTGGEIFSSWDSLEYEDDAPLPALKHPEQAQNMPLSGLRKTK